MDAMTEMIEAPETHRAHQQGSFMTRTTSHDSPTTGGVGSRAATNPTEEFLTVWPVTILDWRRGHFLT
jgi:hypothetical protein